MHVVVSVRDSAVGQFMRPFFAPARGAAQRAFSDEVNRSGSEMNAHPEDYELYFLGEWNEDSARFKLLEIPELMVRAKDVYRENKS